MGSLILCHKKKAKHPYEISRIHTRISTLEELCYYPVSYTHLLLKIFRNKSWRFSEWSSCGDRKHYAKKSCIP